jgi:hypothetical protein
MVRQDHGSFFTSLSLASVQAGTLALPLTFFFFFLYGMKVLLDRYIIGM